MAKCSVGVCGMKRVLLATACSLIGIGAGAQQKEPLQFSGICDASAAIALDENRIIVGDDEKPWLSIYRLDTLTPEGTVPLPFGEGKVTKHGKKKPPELDIEAAAVFKDRIVWISSHGRDGEGAVDRDRLQLFASHRLAADTGAAVESFSVSFQGLLDAVLAQTKERYRPLRDAIGDLTQPNEKLAPKDQGFNIEGMTTDRDGNALLIGLRNPTIDDKAALFELVNAEELLSGKKNPAVLGDIVLLDLGRKRGIRDIVWSPAHQAYLIAAGPKKDDPDHPNFALFKWKGGKDGRLEEIAAFASVMMANPDFHLEAVMPLKERRDAKLVDTKQVLLISDDGSRLVGGDECKKLDATKQSFRAVIRTIE